MRAPPSLVSLLEDGLIEAVLRPLQSGKEAQVYLVRAGGETCVAKIYKAADERNFKNRSEYQEGRGTRNSRDQRAMKRRSRYGRSRDEEAWRSTEVEMIHRLGDAGVRVPKPHLFSEGVLIMELVQGADGTPAPRLGDLRVSAEEAVTIHDALLRDVVRMLCAGVVHGDLSEFNVLIDEAGPVIIDLPQAVDAASNPNARKLLLRDVENLQRFITRWVPGQRRRPFAAEMWALYEVNELSPDTELTGIFKGDEGLADTGAVLDLIADAEEDETQRRLGRGQKALGAKPAGPRVVVNQNLPPRGKQRRKKKPGGNEAKPAAAPPAAGKAPSLNELVARAMAAKAAESSPEPAPPKGRSGGGSQRAEDRERAAGTRGRGRRRQGSSEPPKRDSRSPERSREEPGSERRRSSPPARPAGPDEGSGGGRRDDAPEGRRRRRRRPVKDGAPGGGRSPKREGSREGGPPAERGSDRDRSRRSERPKGSDEGGAPEKRRRNRGAEDASRPARPEKPAGGGERRSEEPSRGGTGKTGGTDEPARKRRRRRRRPGGGGGKPPPAGPER